MNYVRERYATRDGDFKDPMARGIELMGKETLSPLNDAIAEQPEEQKDIAYTSHQRNPEWKSPMDSVIQILQTPSPA